MGTIEDFYANTVIVVNNEGKIIYSNIYNNVFGEKQFSKAKCNNGTNIVELFPDFNREEGDVFKICKSGGALVFKEGQVSKDYQGNWKAINSLKIPIIKDEEVVGVIVLTQDVESLKKLCSKYKSKSAASPACCEDKASIGHCFCDIITKNPVMLSNIEKAKLIANNPSPVFIYGETGTGKEIYVSSIHYFSDRSEEPFLIQNSAALPETLFESILFGTTKGAFTGAVDKPGLFELAHKGTLFLDEINAMPVHLQAKLLRVIQDGVVRRVGDSTERKVDVRIIAAMNIDPITAINTGKLREDLFYRLNVVSLKLIPLRERREDIPLYIEYFIDMYNQKFKKRVSGVTNEIEDFFMTYNWPGNVREIQHAIEASVSIAGHGKISVYHLPAYLAEKIHTARDENSTDETGIAQPEKRTRPLRDTIENIERNIIIKTLGEVDGNVSQAADILDITRQSLHYKLNKYNINRQNS